MNAPSIFNDVIGPVMRGPSSSHAAGGARIANLIRQAAGGDIAKVSVYFDPAGSLAESHDGHGTDMGFACGLLDLPLTTPGIDKWQDLIKESGIELEYLIESYGAVHPNNYRIRCVTGSGKVITADAISTGGGMIELVRLNGETVSVLGDKEQTVVVNGEEFHFSPVLPTLTKPGQTVPFRTAEEMISYAEENKISDISELAILYESARGGETREATIEKMNNIYDIMDGSLKTGLNGTEYKDRILPAQSHLMSENAGRLVPGDVTNTAIRYITAVMEAKSSMGVFVAAPTAGSAGCLPGTVLAMCATLGKSKEYAVKALFAAGMIGVFYAEQATFAAEVGGCQVECGAASGMAAAAVVQLMGGNVCECVDAASFALQGLTGLACDPVANRVEVPCLNKNIVGGMNAISSANVILAGYDKVIPLDETIKAMYDIGTKLPLELRCTYGGLGKTETSNAILKTLAE